ncbi:unnamed protein product [Symbiodinium sp. CCMP2592]|nr:unnamed protein product [Symbiodinium sp. CCMP2592]
MASLVPKKPSTPPPHTRPPRRHRVLTPASDDLLQEQGRKRSKSSPSVLLSASSASSMCSTSPPALPDLERWRVRFEEAPEVILFLSDPEEGRPASCPVLRPLAPIFEEAERPQRDLAVGIHDSISAAPEMPRPMPRSHDCERGLSALSAERRAAMFQNLFCEKPQS